MKIIHAILPLLITTMFFTISTNDAFATSDSISIHAGETITLDFATMGNILGVNNVTHMELAYPISLDWITSTGTGFVFSVPHNSSLIGGEYYCLFGIENNVETVHHFVRFEILPPRPVLDTIPPVIIAPHDVTTNATGIATYVNLRVATATDLVDSTITITNNAPYEFPIGQTIVTWTATDDAGNTSNDTQLVTTIATKSITVTHVVDGNTTLPFTEGMTIHSSTPKFRGTSSGIDYIELVLCGELVGGKHVQPDGSFKKGQKTPLLYGTCHLEAKYGDGIWFSAKVVIIPDDN